MTPSIKKMLINFAENADWGSTLGNTADIERFSDFIIAAYKSGERDIELDDFLDVVGHAENSTSPDPSSKRRGRYERDDKQRKRELAAKMFYFAKYEEGIKLLQKFEQNKPSGN